MSDAKNVISHTDKGFGASFLRVLYLLLFKHIDVFDHAKRAEQLWQVIHHLGGGAPLTAG